MSQMWEEPITRSEQLPYWAYVAAFHKPVYFRFLLEHFISALSRSMVTFKV